MSDIRHLHTDEEDRPHHLCPCLNCSLRFPNVPAHGSPDTMLAVISLLRADGSVAFAGLPADALLATRALGRDGDDSVATARLCEHFEGHGTCNRGHKCRFAHRAAVAAASTTTTTTTTTTTSETAVQLGALAARAASDATPIASSGSGRPRAARSPPRPRRATDRAPQRGADVPRLAPRALRRCTPFALIHGLISDRREGRCGTCTQLPNTQRTQPVSLASFHTRTAI